MSVPRKRVSSIGPLGLPKSWFLLSVGVTAGVLITIIIYESNRSSSSRSFEVFKFYRRPSLDVLMMVITWPPTENVSNGKPLKFAVWDLSGDDWADYGVRKGKFYFLIPGDWRRIDVESHPIVWVEDVRKDRIIGYDYITPNKSIKKLESGEFWRLLLDVLATTSSRIGIAEFDGQRWKVPPENDTSTAKDILRSESGRPGV